MSLQFWSIDSPSEIYDSVIEYLLEFSLLDQKCIFEEIFNHGIINLGEEVSEPKLPRYKYAAT